ncbi:hypothetical protein JAAARDRAFT_539081 [Jaapia argillacea MUCL 33604]|uniref:Uncharacterized protein n=1 Tax=Jaapia argillacea MUCL 33604 TaxID=933084 RepID=A0A067P8B9_9AGAM|nr:hypothetical protein JAAARDRAFT_539081 [Jaapia argillacea MUCL 33604]
MSVISTRYLTVRASSLLCGTRPPWNISTLLRPDPLSDQLRFLSVYPASFSTYKHPVTLRSPRTILSIARPVSASRLPYRTFPAMCADHSTLRLLLASTLALRFQMPDKIDTRPTIFRLSSYNHQLQTAPASFRDLPMSDFMENSFRRAMWLWRLPCPFGAVRDAGRSSSTVAICIGKNHPTRSYPTCQLPSALRARLEVSCLSRLRDGRTGLI